MTAYQFIQKNLGRFTVREMTGLFGVSRGAKKDVQAGTKILIPN